MKRSRAFRSDAPVFAALGEYEEALAHYKRSLKIDNDLGDRLGLTRKLGNVGQLYMDVGDYGRAERYLSKALTLGNQLAETVAVIDATITLGQVHLKRGEHKQGRETLEKGLEQAIAAKNRYQEIRALVYLAFCDVGGDKPEGALSYAQSAARLAKDAVIPQGEVYAMAAEALALGKLGRVDEALARAAQAVAIIDGGREVEGVEEILHVHGKLLQQVGRTEEASQRRSLGTARNAPMRPRASPAIR